MANPFFTEPNTEGATADDAKQVLRALGTQESHVQKASALPGSNSENNKAALELLCSTQEKVSGVLMPKTKAVPEAPKNTIESDVAENTTSHSFSK